MTWEEAVHWLFALERRGVKLDLGRMRDCLEDLGRPQDAFASVLVAGTNGKGSTAATLASCLSGPGRRVGLYTSPHLLEYRERIRLDGGLAPPEELLERVERDREIWEKHELSFFEATTALAFSYFRQAGVSLAVLEVGLGGRLDATNTVEPILSVITQLGLDHAHLLGDTAAAIAREKAGILRPEVPAAVAGGSAEAVSAVAERAGELGTPLFLRRASLQVTDLAATHTGATFRLHPRAGGPKGFSLPPAGLAVRTPLPGLHQVGNAALAVLALALLREEGVPVSDEEIVTGISRLRWPGRLERPRSGLSLLADVAHNREGARVVARYLASACRQREIRPVLGMVEHKDHAGFFLELRRIAHEAWIAPLGTERTVSGQVLEEAARQAGLRVHLHASIPAALDDALSGASEPVGPLVLLSGSFHTLEEGYRHLGLEPAPALWEDAGAPDAAKGAADPHRGS